MTTGSTGLRMVHSIDEVISGLGLSEIAPPPPTSSNSGESAGQSRSGLPSEFFIRCKDGERTSHLTRLAGKLIQQQLPIDIVKVLAREWNQRNFELLPSEKVDSTCESIWKTHQHNHPDDILEKSVNASAPLFDLEEARISILLNSPPPPRRWLLDQCLPYGKVAALVAPGGTGKSQFLLQLATCVATGVPFLGQIKVPDPGGVLVLAAEDDKEELGRRLYGIMSILTQRYRDDDDLIRRAQDNLLVRSMVSDNNLMTRADKGSKEVCPTDYVPRLVQTAKQIPNLKLIIVDPASRFRGGDENAAQDTTRFIEQLEKLCQETGATVIVAHHTNKGSLKAEEQSQNASRGSAAFTDGVRWQMNLLPLSKKAAQASGISEQLRRNYIEAEIVKSNYGPPTAPILLRRGDGGFLDVVTSVEAVAEKQDDLLKQVRALLLSEKSLGIQHTKTSFEDKFGGNSGPLKVGKVTLRGQLSAWVSQGTIKVDNKNRLEADSPMPSGIQPSSGKSRVKTKG